MRTELTMLDFRAGVASPPRALDRVSFLGTRGIRCSPLGLALPSQLGATELSGGLALVGMYYINMFLGFETIFRSPGT